MTTITQTTNKIQSLTPEQVAAMPEYVNKWASIGLSTEPTDEDKGTAAIIDMYKIGGYKAPKVYWFDSPLAATLMAAGFCSRISGRKFSQISLNLGDQMFDLMRGCIRDQVSDRVFNLAIDRISTPTRYRGSEKVFDYIRDQVLDQARFNEVDSLIKTYWYWWIPGGLDMAHACALYDFFANAMHLDIGYEELAPIIGVAEQALIVYTFRDRAYAVRKMRKCSFDEKGRLHCEDGPAVLFNDGFAIYAWRGERLRNGITK
jgi:hypothetical protein